MKKYISLIVALFILLIIWSAFYLFQQVQQEEKPREIEMYTDITELYSQFEPHTKRYTDYYLRGINCEPTSYYYKNDTYIYSEDDGKIYPFYCFVCNGCNPCFGFTWVNRGLEEKMNIIDVNLDGNCNMNEHYNFYTYGIADVLNCECEENCTCRDGIKLSIVEPMGPIFVFPGKENEGKLMDIAEEWGAEEECIVVMDESKEGHTLKIFECGEFVIKIVDFNQVMFGV